jgi:hypothetical protein
MQIQNVILELNKLTRIDVNKIDIELIPVEGKTNRYSVSLNAHSLSGLKKNFILGFVEKNYFQPDPSEKFPSELIGFLESEFENLWVKAKDNFENLNQRWNFIKEKLNENLLF